MQIHILELVSHKNSNSQVFFFFKLNMCSPHLCEHSAGKAYGASSTESIFLKYCVTTLRKKQYNGKEA